MENNKFNYKYPHPAVTADCVLFANSKENKIKVLLIKRKNEPYKDCWALPGGFMNIDETAEEAAVRELMEETNIEIIPEQVTLVGVYSNVDRDPRERVISIGFYATLNNIITAKALDDAEDACWFDLDELPEKLAFDHFDVIDDAIFKMQTDALIFNLDDKEYIKMYKDTFLSDL